MRFGFNPRITVIALTGGPSAGKTTTLAIMKQWLEDRGFKVAILPEVATELITAGFPPASEHWPNESAFQEYVLTYSLAREEQYHRMLEELRTEKHLVLICDRGTLDGRAYISKIGFSEAADKTGVELHELRERYKAVIHLETAAAIGAYTRDNNVARRETQEEALGLDRRTWEAWLGHQHHIRVPAQADFDKKKLNVLKALSRILSMPEPFEIERKWRVENFNRSMIPTHAGEVEITQTYLEASTGGEHRVRMRTADGSSSYFETEKFPTYSEMKRIEKEKQVSRSQYQALLEKADPERAPIRKIRYTWEYDNRTLELDVYQDIPGLAVLEIELPSEDAEVTLPDGWELTEVTRDRYFKNSMIAKLLEGGSAGMLVDKLVTA